MSKLEKLRARFQSRPADYTYSELCTLLGALGYREDQGKSGSRVAFIHKERMHIIRLHRPHPADILKRYQLEQIIAELKAQGEFQ